MLTFLFSPLFFFAIILSIASAAPTCGLVPPKQTAVNVQSSSSTSGDEDFSKVLVAAWYPGWLGATSPPKDISWTKYNMVTFAFALTTPDVNVLELDAQSKELLPEFIGQARNHPPVQALVSIGGWTGSRYFSNHVATAENRAAFVKTVADFINQYQLDGVDFDWEYPNKQGLGCNAISPDDSANFLLFLQALRKEVGWDKVISAAVGTTPFNGPDGEPMTDVSAFATVLDHIVIMAYDVWGSWAESGLVGPNAPLQDVCEIDKEKGSATRAVDAWTNAGFPVNQTALGVAGYGHSFHVDLANAVSDGQLALFPPFDKSKQPPGDSQDGGAGEDQCGNQVGVGGVFNFWGLIEGGFLKNDGTVADGIDYRFDSDCSQTPYVYNRTSQVMVSFDDAKSFAAKGHFLDEKKLYGFSMWHSAGDSNDILLDSIIEAFNVTEECS